MAELIDAESSGPAKRKRFQLHCKKLHLTYKSWIPHEAMLEWLKHLVGPLNWYSIVWEEGHSQENPYRHTHVAFEASRAVTTGSQRHFDFQGVHPNIQPIKTKDHAGVIFNTYHKKEPVKLTQSENGPTATTSSLNVYINAKSLTEAAVLANIQPKTILDLRALRNEREVDDTPEDIRGRCSWIQRPDGPWRVLFLTGATGIGKTRWAIDQFEQPPLIVSHLEDLKRFRPGRHGGLIFDDISLRSFEPRTLIHLVDSEIPRTLNVKHGSITIPANTRKIFTSNESLEATLPSMPEELYRAIRRRLTVWEPTGRLYGDTLVQQETVAPRQEATSSGAGVPPSPTPSETSTRVLAQDPEHDDLMDDEEITDSQWNHLMRASFKNWEAQVPSLSQRLEEEMGQCSQAVPDLFPGSPTPKRRKMPING